MKNKLFLSLLLTSIQMSGQVTAASCPLRFTEVCVANIDQTIDHSNNYGSWVELHNPTDDTVSIEGWYVSDDAGDLKKHRLQGTERIGPRGYGCLFFGHHAVPCTNHSACEESGHPGNCPGCFPAGYLQAPHCKR